MKKCILIVFLVASYLFSDGQGNILFEDNFQKTVSLEESNYWFEGSSKVSITNGRLYIDANPDGNGEDFESSTVWLDRKFSGNIQVDYEAHIISSLEQRNNLNFFFMYSHPDAFELKSSSKNRMDGSYDKYHELNGYIFTFVANGQPDQARFRMRDNPGFNLLQEKHAYHCKQGVTYHITIKKKGALISYLVDGKMWLEIEDKKFNPEHKEGYLGFRTWRTELYIDNFSVSHLD